MAGDPYRDRWHHYKGKVRAKWGKLTDNDLEQINGRREKLLGKLQSRYGWQSKQAEEELKRFERSLEGEKGQKISAEYEREEEYEEIPEQRTQKYNREYFEEEEERRERKEDEEDQDFPGTKRKAR